jgi:CTP synthase (UTP-ammonia lyase)
MDEVRAFPVGIESRLIHVELGEGKEVVVILRAGNSELYAAGLVGDDILFAGTKASDLYGNKDRITERHRHRYEVISDYQDKLQDGGLIISSVSANEGLVEIIELAKHPFYVGAQFHPEFLSKPNHPHPLFSEFVAAAFERTALEDSP